MIRRVGACALAAAVALFASSACKSSSGQKSDESQNTSAETEQREAARRAIEEMFAGEGQQAGDVYRITWPREELDVQLDEFRLVPRMGLTAWAAFAPAPEGVVVTAEIPVRRGELSDLHSVVEGTELELTALHNHFQGEQPDILFAHIGGQGSARDVARATRRVKKAVGLGQSGRVTSVGTDLDPSRLDRAVGVDGTLEQGVYTVSGTFDALSPTLRGRSFVQQMGFGWRAAIQGTSSNAAVAGSFVVSVDRAAPALDVFASQDADVVAVHNRTLVEEPRLVSFHYWDTGPADELARTVGRAREALRDGANSDN